MASYASGFKANIGVGYNTGMGGAIGQGAPRTTTVICNAATGAITTDTTSLAAEGTAKFTVTNSAVGINDVVVLSQQSGSNGTGTKAFVTTVANGSFQIAVQNNNAGGGGAETGAIIINFLVIKGATA